MALRWFFDSANDLNFGHPPKRSSAYPLEGKARDGYNSGCIYHGRGKLTQNYLGWPNELSYAKGIVIKFHENYPAAFQMPLHYPRYKKEDYERMDEWKVDMVLLEYGLTFQGSLEEKRAYAIGTFLWPDQL
ncbi:hypothetical protein CKAN_00108600 [Cinnamomum micranthum f. kanehirae]|uniref:DUF7722 domain-containing protein n=1 Tax=Cinnamomum micranthum f. kanehirae TaxID=337451 RepID=A0A3S3LWI6_9MAGN|nr:hypothetical protein CKAN_00108600 [Cinnamomum micranthum f. kanehirae]